MSKSKSILEALLPDPKKPRNVDRNPGLARTDAQRRLVRLI